MAVVLCCLVMTVQSATECDTLCNKHVGTSCSNIFSSVVVYNFKGDKAALFLLCCLGSERIINYKFNYIKNNLYPHTLLGIFYKVSSALTSKKFAVFVRNCSKGGRLLTWRDWLAFDAGRLYCDDNPCP